VTFVDLADLDRLARALHARPRLVWVETPSNPLLRVTDLARVAEAASRAGALTVCDNTWATPVLQRPLELGADLVVHSTTKYLGGHGDLMGGAVVARTTRGLFERVRQIQVEAGAVPSPFDAWLLLRSLRTLPCRMRAHSEHARRVAAFLARHPAVETVHYPGLADHPGHAVAARQMADFGGMLAVQVRGGRAAALGVAARVRLFRRATSLGSVESLVEHRASMEGPESRTPDNLLRLSIGLEHPEDLIEDLDRALAAAAP
jgi:cystathionine gamma-synthase